LKVIKGKVKKPIAILVYGVHGVGKSTFATEAENPIFIGSEENDELNADRYPKINEWKDLTDQLELVKKSNYQTIVIDTMDELERIAQNEILKKEPGKTMATACGGYGKANEVMERMFLGLRDTLSFLRNEKGMNVIILCHHEKTKYEDPISLTNYDNYSTALHKKLKPIFEDWVSIIAFANDKLMRAENSQGKDTVISDGDRVMYFESRTSHVAKNRFKLPSEIEFPESGTWAFIKNHVDEFFGKKEEVKPVKPTDKPKKEVDKSLEKEIEKDQIASELDHDLIEEIKETIGKIKNEAIRPKVEVSLARATTNEELKRILDKAKSLI